MQFVVHKNGCTLKIGKCCIVDGYKISSAPEYHSNVAFQGEPLHSFGAIKRASWGLLGRIHFCRPPALNCGGAVGVLGAAGPPHAKVYASRDMAGLALGPPHIQAIAW